MADDFPRRVEEITPAWLSGVLGGPVVSFDVTFLEGGVLSDAFKLHGIVYEGDADGLPTSVVAKLSNQVPDRRAFALMANAYAKELNFFRHLASEVPLRVPTMYCCLSDDSAAARRGVRAQDRARSCLHARQVLGLGHDKASLGRARGRPLRVLARTTSRRWVRPPGRPSAPCGGRCTAMTSSIPSRMPRCWS